MKRVAAVVAGAAMAAISGGICSLANRKLEDLPVHPATFDLVSQREAVEEVKTIATVGIWLGLIIAIASALAISWSLWRGRRRA